MTTASTFTPTPFRDRGFGYRYKRLGDLAEGQFKAWAARHNVAVERFGFNRPDIKGFPRFNAYLRYTPDYVAEDRSQSPYHQWLCEVKGCGHDQTIKIKHETYNALGAWQGMAELPVEFFLYDSHRNRVTRRLTFDLLVDLLPKAETGVFPDNGKTWFGIPTDWVDGWEDVPAKEA